MALLPFFRIVCLVVFTGLGVAAAPGQENYGVLGESGEILPGSENSKSSEQTPAEADARRISPLQTNPSTIRITPNALLDLEERDRVQARIDGLWSRLNTIEAAVDRGGLNAPTLQGLENRVNALRDAADQLRASINTPLSSVERSLLDLGTAEQGTVEPASLSAQRKKYQAAQQVLSGLSRQARIVSAQAQDLSSRIAFQRREVLRASLLHRNDSILSPDLWARAMTDLSTATTALKAQFQNWVATVEGQLGAFGVPALLVYFFASIPLIWWLRRWLLGKASRDPDLENPDWGLKSRAAVLIVVSSVLAPLAIGVTFFWVVQLLEVSSDQLNVAMIAIFGGILFATFTFGVSSALLAPFRPQWRIADMSDEDANSAYRFSLLAAVIYAVFVAFVIVIKAVPEFRSLSAVIAGVLSIGVAVCTFQILRSVSEVEREVENEDVISVDGLWSWVKPVVWIGTLVAFLAPFAGFFSLGGFVSTQIIWTMLSLFTLSLLLRFVEDWFAPNFAIDKSIGSVLHDGLGLRASTLEQIGVILSGIAKLGLLLLVAVGLLLPWGYTTGDLLGFADQILSGLQIGSAAISLTSVVGAILLFIGIAFSTKASQRWLERKYLPKTQMDIGLQTSVTTGFGYVGYIVAGLVALAFAGLNLQNIAIVAGALSVGVGLGLQGIVNNFVSGLVVLAERPVKVGDWVIIGADQGYVRRINVRATEIETFDRSTVIIPNSNLISGVVKNWMHNNSTGRITVAVGVSYDSDPEQVREILADCAASHPGVMSFPEPQIYFMAFGDSSLNFEIRCYLPNIERSLQVGSELRFAVFRKLREAGIEIPFPQRDLHIRSGLPAGDFDRGSNNALPPQTPGDTVGDA